jgi:phage FluMu protein Com
MNLPSEKKSPGEQLRCSCGSLLARWVAKGVEIKCRRCKRRWVIALTVEPPALSKSTD